MLIPAAIVAVVIIATSGGSSRKPLLPNLVGSYKNANVGIRVHLPKGWTTDNVRGVLRFRSPDSSAVIALAAFPRPSATGELLLSALRTVLGEYTNTTVKRGPGTKLAGLPARSTVIYGRNRHGTLIRILLAGAKGRSHAYLLDVFTARNTPGNELVQAQEIISTLELTG